MRYHNNTLANKCQSKILLFIGGRTRTFKEHSIIDEKNERQNALYLLQISVL